MHPTSSGPSTPSPPPTPMPALRLSALEVAAKRGIGPLSDLGAQVWHGKSRPCVSCGELMRRESRYCDHCGQDHALEMISRMEAHAGPWYVHEHVRPFPGVTLERLIRQARRGVLTATTIVRGPTTHHQWCFAGETPGLCKYVGLCFSCQAAVTEQDMYCPACGIHLDCVPGESAATVAADPAAVSGYSDAATGAGSAGGGTPTKMVDDGASRIAAEVVAGVAAGASSRDPVGAGAPMSASWSQINAMARRSRFADIDAVLPQRQPRIPTWAFVLGLIVIFVGALVVVVHMRDRALSRAALHKPATSAPADANAPPGDSGGAGQSVVPARGGSGTAPPPGSAAADAKPVGGDAAPGSPNPQNGGR